MRKKNVITRTNMFIFANNIIFDYLISFTTHKDF